MSRVKIPHHSSHNNVRMDSNNNKEYPNILAPAPWKSFKEQESTTAMVVKKRAPLPPMEKIVVENHTEVKEIQHKKGKAPPPPPPTRSSSLMSPSYVEKENKEITQTTVTEIFTFETSSP